MYTLVNNFKLIDVKVFDDASIMSGLDKSSQKKPPTHDEKIWFLKEFHLWTFQQADLMMI